MRTAILLFLCFTAVIFAFDNNAATLFVNLSFPQNNFKATDPAIGGSAVTGFGGGLDFTHNFGDTGIGWTTFGNYNLNSYGSDTYAFDDFYLAISTQSNADAPSFSMYSILTGIKYTTQFDSDYSLFLHARYGYNFSKAPELTGIILNNVGDQFEGTMGFSKDSAPAFNFGIGFNLGETFRISLEYFDFGKNTYSTTVKYEENNKVKIVPIDWEVEIQFLMVTLGYNIIF